MLRRLAFVVVFVFSPASLFAETLSDTLISAYRHSGLLDQNRALLRAADEDVAQAVAAMRPVVSYTASASQNSVTNTLASNFEISASLTLLDFGRRQLRIDVAKENVLSLRDALIGVEQNVLSRAVTAHASVLHESAIVTLRNNNLRVAEQELQAARDRLDVGQATRTDVALAEAGLASATSAQASAIGALDVAREEYRAAVGGYPVDLKPLPELPEVPSALEKATAIALQRHPAMSQARHSVRVSELNVDIAEAGMKPTLSVNGRAGVDDAGNKATSIGMSFGGPIYQGGTLASVYRRSAAQRDASRAGLHVTLHDVRQQVANAWSRMKISDVAVEAAGQRVRATRVAFRSVSEEERLGSRTRLDVLSAEQDLLDAEAGEISARTDQYLSVYNLLAAMGLLTVDHLKLGITTYDPAGYYNTVKNAPTTMVSPEGKKLDRVLKFLNKK